MSEEADKLRATLAELHTELEGVSQDDPEVRQLLQTALAEIQQTLDSESESESAAAAEDQSLVERLGGAAKHYEDTHPNVSGTLGGLIDALSRMGI